LTLAIIWVSAAGCDRAGQSDLKGIITQVELGKDGVYVEVKTGQRVGGNRSIVGVI